MNRICMADLGWQYEQIRHRVERDLQKLLLSGQYIGGEYVSGFEKAFAEWHGVNAERCVSCANGSDALYLALKAHGVGAGDTVVTVPNTFVATAHAIERTGAKALFVDVDPELHTMRPECLADAVRPSTVAIIPVHLYGHPVDMGPIMEFATARELLVIEDCAQACGAMWKHEKVGTVGHAGAFSFFPTKTLGAAGDGGAILFRGEEAAKMARGYAHQGFLEEKHLAAGVGINSRLDAVQALILREKLRLLPEWNEMRRKTAEYYTKELSALPGPFLRTPREAAWAKHVYSLYTVQYQGSGQPRARRDSLVQWLVDRGIEARVFYPRLVTDQIPYIGRVQKRMPAASSLVDVVLSLPVYPSMDMLSVTRVCEAVKEWGSR